jgi:hypothetical protein
LIVLFFIPTLWQGQSANPTLSCQNLGDACLYMTEVSNYAIRMIGTNGMVSTIAGSRWYTGYADGIGTNALFN